MKQVNKTLPIDNDQLISLINTYANKNGDPPSSYLFIEIETTGLTPQNSELYLIGCVYYSEVDHCLHQKQFLTSDFSEEFSMLKCFLSFLEPFTHLISLYGNRFTFLYLKECIAEYHLDTEKFSSLTMIDLHGQFVKLKHILSLPDLSKSSLFHLIGFNKRDSYTGEALALLRERSITEHTLENDEIFLLHSEDNLSALTKLFLLTSYRILSEAVISSSFKLLSKESLTTHYAMILDKLDQSFQKETDDEIFPVYGLLTASFHISVPYMRAFLKDGIYLCLEGNTLTVLSKVFLGTRRIYYKDIKNYYYLPNENRIIFRSLASGYAKEERVRATYETCYETQTDYFIGCPYPSNNFYLSSPFTEKVFKKQLEDSFGCVRIRDIEGNEEDFASYTTMATLYALVNDL